MVADLNNNNLQRGLSPVFLKALIDDCGPLRWLLDRVLVDRTLCLEIRNNYINVYYRGGNLLNVAPAGSSFTASFDSNYFADGASVTMPDVADAENGRKTLPQLKDAMDLWFGKNPKNEREYQQQIVRDNNSPSENSTDYFICDLEYDNRSGARFDLLGVRWPSTGSARKNGCDLRLAFMEVKHGDGAIGGDASITKHLTDILTFVEKPGAMPALQVEMRQVFNQKRELGLISKCKNPIESFAEHPEVLLIFSNHDPAKSALRKEIGNARPFVDDLQKLSVPVRVVTSSYCGYAIYEERLMSWDDFGKEVEQGNT